MQTRTLQALASSHTTTQSAPSPPRRTPLRLPHPAELAATVRLAMPIVIVQVGLMAVGVVDTIMVGHVSAAALAAVALGNLYFVGGSIFGQGVLMALDPVIAQAVGARDRDAVARGLQRGTVLCLGLTVLVTLALLPAGPVFRLLHQPPDVVPWATGYVLAVIPGTFPFMGFVVLRQTLQAMGRTREIVASIVGANLLNAGLNWVLIYGHLGAPAMGAVGSAWASTASRWLMLLGLLTIAWPRLAPLLAPRADVLRAAPFRRMLRLGLPIGATTFLEYGAFAAVALLMGLLGTVPMAGHQVALNLASTSFMVPLGVSAAAAVLVGQAIGRGDSAAARRAATAALLCGTAFMLASALAFLAAPAFLARLFTDDPGVLSVATALIPIAGVFQVFDGLQVVGSGILRGTGDTRVPLVVNILGFWLIGMPLSIWLGFRTSAGPKGLWWGLVAGLAAVACFLLLRIRHRFGNEIERVLID